MKVWWTIYDSIHNALQNLTSNDGVLITKTSQKVSMLTIEAVKARHRGNYTCVAQNKAGTTQHSAYLAINGLNVLITFVAFFPFGILQFVHLQRRRRHVQSSPKSHHLHSVTMKT